MAEPFLGEIRVFPFNAAPPKLWHVCDGTLLSVTTYQALYSLIGFTYGGNGKDLFALPDLRGRLAVHNPPALGKAGGEETHVLTVAELPYHEHTATGGSNVLGGPFAANHTWGTTVYGNYAAPGNTPASMAATALSTEGASQGHNNMQPSFVLNYCIAIVGIWPPKP